VRLVVVPPPFMVDALRAGQIDGFCAGEPWNSAAVTAGIGHIALATTAIRHRSPEKVLGLRADWAEQHPDEAAALIRSLYRASQWCDRVESGDELAQLLALPRFIGEPAGDIARGLTGTLRGSPGAAPLQVPEFLGFARHFGTFPWVSHAAWFYSQMVRWQQIPRAGSEAQFAARAAAARGAYRPDLYRAALAGLGEPLPAADLKLEGPWGAPHGSGFFDGRPFDADDLDGYLRVP